jgi:hypothetical protein
VTQLVTERRRERAAPRELHEQERALRSRGVSHRGAVRGEFDGAPEMNEPRARIELGVASRDEDAGGFAWAARVGPELRGAGEIAFELGALRRARDPRLAKQTIEGTHETA